ncbi:MAG: Arc family DNA-binding protein [Bacteroidota bacterium]
MATKKAFVLRIDPAISEALEKWAEDEIRSTNGQLEYIISNALKKAGRYPKKLKKSEDNQQIN